MVTRVGPKGRRTGRGLALNAGELLASERQSPSCLTLLAGGPAVRLSADRERGRISGGLPRGTGVRVVFT